MTHKSKMNRSRNFCFTLNNFDENEIELISNLKCKYCIFGKEKGENGTPHLQGYIMFNNARSFNSVKKLIPRAHIEVAKGSPYSNFEYCSKDNNFIEIGNRPKGQGKRSDIDNIKDLVKSGCNETDLFESAGSFQAFRFGQVGRTLYTEHRKEAPCTIWLWGLSGVGKTKFAFDNSKDVYIKDHTKWWDMYNQNETILIDDFDGSWHYRDLLRLLDRYPYSGQIKGGYVKINSPIIIISCEHPPSYFWSGNELTQIIRRLCNVVELTHDT